MTVIHEDRLILQLSDTSATIGLTRSMFPKINIPLLIHILEARSGI